MEVQVRQAVLADVAACAMIETAVFERSEAASEETIYKRQQTFSDGFIVAEIDSGIVGFINSAATYQPDLADEEFKGMLGHQADGSHLVIFSLSVHPDYQGQGISRILLERFAELAKQQGRKAIMLLCKETLIAYYQKFGFQKLGKSNSVHGGFAWFEMRCSLT